MRHKKTVESLPSWAHAKGFDKSFIHDKAFHDVYLNEGGNNWWFWPGSRDQREIQEAAAEAVGGYLIQMPYNERPDGPGGWLDIGDKLLSPDSFHPSAAGHEDIANRVKEIVDRVGVPKTKHVNSFSSVDQCNNWLQSGIIGEGVSYGPNGSIVQMPNTEKFALEFDFDKSNDGNWITVENQSNQEMDLAIGYMTTGPPPSKYPKVTATLDSSDEEIILDPETSASYGDKEVHITRLENLGVLEPLVHKKIHFKPPLEKTEWPFRLVQIMITPHEKGSIA